MNYELGMHCTGFEFAYCCVLPVYNSILAQIVKPQGTHNADFPALLEGDPVENLDAMGRETVVRDKALDGSGNFRKYVVRYWHDAQPRNDGRGKVQNGTLVSADEVQAFYESGISPASELTEDLKLAIESRLRKQKFSELKGSARQRLRADVAIRIDEAVLGSQHDGQRSVADVVARVGDRGITRGEIEVQMRGADYRASLAEFYLDSDSERLARLQEHVDFLLTVDKARADGMDRDPEFAGRTAEYRKTRLVNIHRDRLLHDMMPTDDELAQYYTDHREDIVVPEMRKVQMVVLGCREEAQRVKAGIDGVSITIYQAAQQFSLDPAAQRTLGEIGWVSHGSGFRELDDFTFGLEPGVVGGPVQSPAGWHLVNVLDAVDAQYRDIGDAETRRLTLKRYLDSQLDDYVIGLRRDAFDVEVCDEVLAREFRAETGFIAELGERAREEGSLSQQRKQELEQWLTPLQ